MSILKIASAVVAGNLCMALEIYETLSQKIISDGDTSHWKMVCFLIDLNATIRTYAFTVKGVDAECVSEVLQRKILSCLDVSDSRRMGREIIHGYHSFLYSKLISSKLTNPVLKEAVRYLEENYHKDVKLDELSRLCNVNKNYLSKLWNKEVGMSLRKYMQTLRCEAAKVFLKTTDYSIEYISDICGFKSQAHFSVVFKKIVGQTPREYRKEALTKQR